MSYNETYIKNLIISKASLLTQLIKYKNNITFQFDITFTDELMNFNILVDESDIQYDKKMKVENDNSILLAIYNIFYLCPNAPQTTTMDGFLLEDIPVIKIKSWEVHY